MKYFKYGNKKNLVIFTMFSLVLASATAATSIAIKEITDSALARDLRQVLIVSLAMLGIRLMSFLIALIAIRFQERYIQMSGADLKEKYINELLNKNLLSINSVPESTYLSQLTNDMDRYQQVFYRNLTSAISIGAEIITGIVLIIFIEPRLLLISAFLVFVALYLSKQTSKPIKKLEKNKSLALNGYTNCIQESLDGFSVIMQYRMQEKQTKKFLEHANHVKDENLRLDYKTSKIDAINSAIQLSLIVVLTLCGIIVAHYVGLSVGTALLIGNALGGSVWPMQQLIPLISQMNGVGAVLDDFERTLASQDFNTPESIQTIANISFNNVVLAYDDHNVVEDVSMNFSENEKILLVGKSGSGKSTLLKSLRRQIVPKSGSILVNNQPLERINPSDYFSQLSVVDQVGFIFNGTVADNITMNRASNVDLHTLLGKVGLDELSPEFLLQNNGNNVSGGAKSTPHARTCTLSRIIHDCL